MKLVVGLGNPGREYAGTRHNIGFAVVDRLAGRLDCSLKSSLRFQARIGKTRRGDNELWLVEPDTFMNRSGDAVGAILRYMKVAVEDLIVVFDDADLELGQLRLRPKGGSGGHRGIQSILETLGSDAFIRVRVGIGRDRGRSGGLVDHVLTPFTVQERDRIEPVVAAAAEAVLCAVDAGVDTAMNRFNNWKIAEPDGEPPAARSNGKQSGER